MIGAGDRSLLPSDFPAGRFARDAAVLTLAVLAAWTVVDGLVARIGLPLAFSYVEGFNVNDAVRLAHGVALYGDPSRPPFVSSVYTPLYTALVAGMIALGLPGLLSARLVSLLSATLLAGAIGLSGRLRTGRVACIAALLFLLSPLQRSWMLVARPDYTAALLSVLGIIVAARGAAGPGALWAAPLVAAAILTKQSYVAAALTVTIIFMARSPRRGLVFAATLVALLGGAVAALSWSSNGWFLFHAVTANRNPFSWENAGVLADRFLSSHAPEWLLMSPALVPLAITRRVSVFGLYAVIAAAASISSGKLGSDSNYFIEPLAAAALLAANEFPLAWLVARGRPGRVACAALCAAAVILGAIRFVELRQMRRSLPGEVTVFERMCRDLAARPGPAVSDDAVLLGCAGKDVIFQPFVMTQLAEAKRWDQRPFLESLSDGRIPTVIVQTRPEWLFRSRYTAEMRESLRKRYRPGATYEMSVDLAAFELTVLEAAPRAPGR